MLSTGELPGNVDSAGLVGAGVHRDDGTAVLSYLQAGLQSHPAAEYSFSG